eukprot:TRINITY_DN122073_c0_g1_i1.p1 TRINITY_DN122073_c0_g1~~TRINITY_DN122073_c0_g1_i1.p1  ORF type:complete len:626 (-),score=141.59 TRINITY_DN122073_c0_g1_i1:175-2052(-)
MRSSFFSFVSLAKLDLLLQTMAFLSRRHVFICVLVLICASHLDGVRVTMQHHERLYSNSTELAVVGEPISLTVIGFTLGTISVVGAMRSLYLSIAQKRVLEDKQRWAEETLRLWKAHTAEGCKLLINVDTTLKEKAQLIEQFASKSSDLNDVCTQVEEPVRFAEAAAAKVRASCDELREVDSTSKLVAEAVEKCEAMADQRKERGVSELCNAGSKDKLMEVRHSVEIARAKINGLRSGLCPKEIPADWFPPAAKTDEIPRLLTYYPKCKRPVGRRHSRYCWTSCVAKDETAGACEALHGERMENWGLTVKSTGVVAERPKGVSVGGHSMVCTTLGFKNKKQRALCEVGTLRKKAKSSSDSSALVQTGSESEIVVAAVLSTLGLAYSVVSVGAFANDLADSTTKAIRVKANEALEEFMDDRMMYEEKALCKGATTCWLEMVSTHGGTMAAFLERFVQTGLTVDDAMAVAFGASSVPATSGMRWAAGNANVSALLKPGSVWKCAAASGGGCLVQERSAASSEELSESLSFTETSPMKSCMTSAGDYRICDKQIVAAIAPTACFRQMATDSAAAAFAVPETMGNMEYEPACVDKLVELEKVTSALKRTKEELLNICDTVGTRLDLSDA